MAHPPSSTCLQTHGYLFFLIPQIFVYVLASILFEFSMNKGIAELQASVRLLLAPSEDANVSLQLSDMRARYIWLTTVLVNFVVFTYATGLCGLIIYRSHPRGRLLTI